MPFPFPSQSRGTSAGSFDGWDVAHTSLKAQVFARRVYVRFGRSIDSPEQYHLCESPLSSRGIQSSTVCGNGKRATPTQRGARPRARDCGSPCFTARSEVDISPRATCTARIWSAFERVTTAAGQIDEDISSCSQHHHRRSARSSTGSLAVLTPCPLHSAERLRVRSSSTRLGSFS
jgi:hypothetical protein